MNGNNLLIELARRENDGVVGELLTHPATSPHIKHSLLMQRNKDNQTVMSILASNMGSLPESLAITVKREYKSHQEDYDDTEQCLARQLGTSCNATAILKMLRDLQPLTCCAMFGICLSLFLFSFLPVTIPAFATFYNYQICHAASTTCLLSPEKKFDPPAAS